MIAWKENLGHWIVSFASKPMLLVVLIAENGCDEEKTDLNGQKLSVCLNPAGRGGPPGNRKYRELRRLDPGGAAVVSQAVGEGSSIARNVLG